MFLLAAAILFNGRSAIAILIVIGLFCKSGKGLSIITAQSVVFAIEPNVTVFVFYNCSHKYITQSVLSGIVDERFFIVKSYTAIFAIANPKVSGIIFLH